jgi:hypothetical protein
MSAQYEIAVRFGEGRGVARDERQAPIGSTWQPNRGWRRRNSGSAVIMKKASA